MKKTFMLIIGTLFLISCTAFADDDKPITFEQLPNNAQEFIKTYFPAEKIAFAKMENEMLGTSYDVTFTTSTNLEFDGNGDWTEVDCRYSQVPDGIVPTQILAKVNELYKDSQIIAIDRDKHDYEVKLNNNLELKFNLNLEFIGLDD